MNLKIAFDLFLVNCRVRNLSDKTIECYEEFVLKFINMGFAQDVAEMTYEVVEKYILCLRDQVLAVATMATYIRHLKVFIKWLETEKYIQPFSEKVRVPRTPKKVVRIYTDDEIRQIFDVIQNVLEWIRLRNCCIVALMLDSGVRQKEICNIELSDLNLRDSMLKIRGKGSKERIVPLGKLTQHFLTQYMKNCPHQSDMLFVSITGKKLTRNAVKLLISKLAKLLPFEFSSHKLRHNFATNYCLDQYEKYGTIDIYKLMVLMGHEDIKTTRRYLHLANQIIASKSNISHIDKILLGSH